MRSKERLIEVLESVGPAVGLVCQEALHDAAKLLDGRRPTAACNMDEAIYWARYFGERHQSPHVRDLAQQAAFYIEKEV